MHIAVSTGISLEVKSSAEIVRELLKAGAKASLKDNLGHTAYYYAMIVGNKEILDELIKAEPRLKENDKE